MMEVSSLSEFHHETFLRFVIKSYHLEVVDILDDEGMVVLTEKINLFLHVLVAYLLTES
jgi:hypothetical protein